ncbi:D-alanine--D-alanine ligase [Dissostichus eleginoides]|uniref:D-alanine--D-alanine ligase n=1 Tax=Dissostichus eleginoides TaxID=100907 RepID=A0AAD9BPB8_DISEL|nr:D-alanine--D-alanine ligase [Dissostichus eleginoides]
MIIPLQPNVYGSQPANQPTHRQQPLFSPYGYPMIVEPTLPQNPANPPPNSPVLPAETLTGPAPPVLQQQQMAAEMGQLAMYLTNLLKNSPAGAILPVSQAAGLANPEKQGMVPTAGTSAGVPQTGGLARSGPQPNTNVIPRQMYMEFDIVHAPAQAEHLIPAGAPADTLDVLLPVDAKGRPIAGLGRGFIKQDISWPNVKGTREVYYPFGFDPPKPAPVVPAAPVVPVAPVAPVAPVVPAAPAVPAAPVQRIVAASKPVSWHPIKDEVTLQKIRSTGIISNIDSHHLLQSSIPEAPQLLLFILIALLVVPPFASHGFMKISIPQPPGRQSVEVYYPYDFSQQRGLPFDFPPQNIPQQIPNIPTFDTGFNALPSQDPLQTLQQDQPTQTNKMTKFIKKLCARFMKPSALQGRQVHDILYKDPLNQLPGEKLNVGFTTRATLNRLLEAGDITPQEVQLFQQAALAFLVRAVEYGINKLPLKEALLRHTRFVDVQQRTECGVEDALYFIDRFQELLPFHGPEEQDKVCEEFLEYQLMDIPMPQDPTTFNVEEFWGSMSSIKCKEKETTMMKLVVFMMCLLATTLAAPVAESESNEEKVAAHANEALRWMEMYRMYQQQGVVGNPFLPAADAPVDAAPAEVAPPAPVAAADASEEENEDEGAAPKAAAAVGAPLNSDEEEEAEEVEAAEAEPAVEVALEEPAADPEADVEPAVVDVPVDAAMVDAAVVVDVVPVDVVPAEVAPSAPEVAVNAPVPAAADVPADVPAAVDVHAAADAADAPLVAETDTTGVAADPALV